MLIHEKLIIWSFKVTSIPLLTVPAFHLRVICKSSHEDIIIWQLVSYKSYSVGKKPQTNQTQKIQTQCKIWSLIIFQDL